MRLSSSSCTPSSTCVCESHHDLRCKTARQAPKSAQSAEACVQSQSKQHQIHHISNPKSHSFMPPASLETHCTSTKTACDSSCAGTQAAQWADVLSKMREEDKQNATQWVQHHTQPCPGCGSRIQKNGGCNHMSCAVCRRQFCWVGSPSASDAVLILDTILCRSAGHLAARAGLAECDHVHSAASTALLPTARFACQISS